MKKLLFSIFALVLLFLGYWGYSLFYPQAYKKYVLYTKDSIHGMVVSSPVEYRGVNIGEVLKTELTNESLVKITLGIKKSIPVSTNTKATIITRGLASSGFTGYVYVSLDNIEPNQPQVVVEPGQLYPEIKVKKTESDSMDLNFAKVLSNLSSILAILESTLDKETQISLKHFIKNMDRVSHTLATNSNRLNALIINFEKISGQMNPLLRTGNSALIMAQTQMMPELYQALSNLNTFFGVTTSLATKLDRDPSILIRGIQPTNKAPGESH